MITLTPTDRPGHWRYYADEVEFELIDTRCTCGGGVVVLSRRYGQTPVVCTQCPGRFPDKTLEPWIAAGRKLRAR